MNDKLNISNKTLRFLDLYRCVHDQAKIQTFNFHVSKKSKLHIAMTFTDHAPAPERINPLIWTTSWTFLQQLKYSNTICLSAQLW